MKSSSLSLKPAQRRLIAITNAPTNTPSLAAVKEILGSGRNGIESYYLGKGPDRKKRHFLSDIQLKCVLVRFEKLSQDSKNANADLKIANDALARITEEKKDVCETLARQQDIVLSTNRHWAPPGPSLRGSLDLIQENNIPLTQ